ncbi:unnamed protein product [Angiostrongylus costaricensis]|uniref:CarD_TRCF domain-containing protein n=1 Tax=Angiostrongylus costaricensis TaxID=334426 RepID=A0A0R3PRX9_ANGCS|nr:unnamed protein product [Angiostrongylus costaricensis]
MRNYDKVISDSDKGGEFVLVEKRGIREVQDLIRLKTIRLSVSDKGGEFVVIPHQLDVEITKKHLEDASLYRPSSEEEFKSKYRKLNHEWTKMARAAGLKPSVISQLKAALPNVEGLHHARAAGLRST